MGVLGFRVSSRDTVDRIYADLTGAGYKSQQPPCDAFWALGTRSFRTPTATRWES
jgi:uncharacterized glyoxalase superfamily protein PhnB